MKHPPYHLRTNKAIDRLLLVDLLREYGGNCKDYTYYSLAGPFLEDLRVIDHFFPDIRLVSLEKNNATFQRQKFHLFSRDIELLPNSLNDFLVHEYEPKDKDVFWLDYTNLAYRNFEEFQVLLKKVSVGSIVKITLFAQPRFELRGLGERVSDQELSRLEEELEQDFVEEFEKILPHPRPSAFAGKADYAATVQSMVRRSAAIALDTPGSDVDFLPVQTSRYSDNVQMVSVTGIVCLRADIEKIKGKLQNLSFLNFAWDPPEEIDIPMLSVKERLHLESHLPVPDHENPGEYLFNIFNYMIDDSEKRTRYKLENYALHYRKYPSFVRIAD